MIEIPELVKLGLKFARGPFEPLTVTAVMRHGAPLCSYDPIHFDGLLAKAVVIAALKMQTLPDAVEPYWLPLPLAQLWTSDDGLPLWAASVLRPYGDTVGTEVYLHKRNAPMTFSNSAKLETGKGRYMERRIPVPTQVAFAWQARVIGNREWLNFLLPQFTNIGKHRSRGMGAVKEWRISDAGWTADDIVKDAGMLIKPIPEEAGLIAWPGSPVPVGWTPPQWKPSLFRMGWPAGTTLQPDWFGLADIAA